MTKDLTVEKHSTIEVDLVEGNLLAGHGSTIKAKPGDKI
jgi:hypothetical protein